MVTKDEIAILGNGKVSSKKRKGDDAFEGVEGGGHKRGFQNKVGISPSSPPPSSPANNDSTLRGGLRVINPPTWRLDQPRELLHDLVKEHGVVMIPEVITQADAEAFSSGIKDAFDSCNATWAEAEGSAPSPGTRGHGLQKLYGVALSEASQKLRCHKNAMKVSLFF